MLRGRSFLRSFLDSSLSYNCYYDNSRHCGCSYLMSSATTAAMSASASVSSFTSARRLSSASGAVPLSSSKIGAKINNFNKPGFRLRGCCFDEIKQINSINNNNNIKDDNFNNYSSSVNGNEVQKARQYAPSLARLQLLRGSEGGDPTTVLDRGDGGASQRGSCVRSSGENGGKFVVAVDVDEVLGNFVSALNRFIADRYSLNHSVSEYHVYEFFKIWNCSRNEADIRVHEFFKTSYFKKGIHPIPGAQEALQKLSRFCDLSIVTSRQNAIKEDTIEWIEKHFPGIFQEIHFGNHFALDGLSRPKSDICRSLGAKVLIDDNPRYAIECAEVGMRVLLFDYENSYPWSKMDSLDQHPLVTKVHNWKEVEHHIASWSVS